MKTTNRKIILRNLGFTFISFIVISMSNSCTSIYKRTEMHAPSRETYIGTSEDLKYIIGFPFYVAFGGSKGCLALPIGLLDLPFSFAYDTLLLPTDLTFGAGSVIGKQGMLRGERFTVIVVDENGLPLHGAYISPYGLGRNIGFTNENGIYIGKKPTGYKIDLDVEMDGYYKFAGWERSLERVVNDNKKETLKVVMIKRINPVPMLRKEVRFKIPSWDETKKFYPRESSSWGPKQPLFFHPITFGFDFEEGDWTEPYGKGKITDMTVKFSTEGASLEFTNPNDGMFPYEKKDQGHVLPVFNDVGFPRQAPGTGYTNNVIWKNQPKTTTYWVFRVRTQVNEDGSVMSANYGWTLGYMTLYPRQLIFQYYYNPDSYSRSLEPIGILYR